MPQLSNVSGKVSMTKGSKTFSGMNPFFSEYKSEEFVKGISCSESQYIDASPVHFESVKLKGSVAAL